MLLWLILGCSDVEQEAEQEQNSLRMVLRALNRYQQVQREP